MNEPIQFPSEDQSNAARRHVFDQEPVALRTYTPSQAVFEKSAGVFHVTPEGRRLYDYASGVLVANLGHNPRSWMKRFCSYMGWKPEHVTGEGEGDYFEAVTMTAYNAITPVEEQAVARLLANLQASAGGGRCEQVMWAASGSEAVQKALWCCLNRDPKRDVILATRYGFHGKKGLAEAVTGSEKDKNRDPRVRFISFPMEECDDLSTRKESLDLTSYRAELDALEAELGGRINCLITEPYLGGGGSYHPQPEYLQMLQQWCRERDIVFILDEVQANFGRTGKMYAFETYGIEPDLVCLGKGLGNGVPVSATVGRADLMGSLKYGEASDTWSANPIACAAVLATLDEFEQTDVMENTARLNRQFVEGLTALKQTGLIAKVRGEGMVFGLECAPAGGRSASEVANEIVRACYIGRGDRGIHLLGPLASCVLRVSPPMTMTQQEAQDSLQLLHELIAGLAD